MSTPLRMFVGGNMILFAMFGPMAFDSGTPWWVWAGWLVFSILLLQFNKAFGRWITGNEEQNNG